MNDNIKKLIGKMACNTPTSRQILIDVEEKLGVKFPDQYIDFILEFNGAEGNIGNNSYLVIWAAEDIVKLNDEYEVNKFTPGLVYFGSDGGGRAYAFDYRMGDTLIVEFPFESIHIEDAKIFGDTFAMFLEALSQR